MIEIHVIEGNVRRRAYTVDMAVALGAARTSSTLRNRISRNKIQPADHVTANCPVYYPEDLGLTLEEKLKTVEEYVEEIRDLCQKQIQRRPSAAPVAVQSIVVNEMIRTEVRVGMRRIEAVERILLADEVLTAETHQPMVQF